MEPSADNRRGLSKYAQKRIDELLGVREPFEFKTSKADVVEQKVDQKPMPKVELNFDEGGVVEAKVVRIRGRNSVFLKTDDGMEVFLSLRLLRRNVGDIPIDVGSTIICTVMENKPPSPPGVSASMVISVDL